MTSDAIAAHRRPRSTAVKNAMISPSHANCTPSALAPSVVPSTTPSTAPGYRRRAISAAPLTLNSIIPNVLG